MITVTCIEKGQLIVKSSEKLKPCNLENLIWVDLFKPTDEEKNIIEKLLDIKFQTKQEVEEIESSSRYVEKEDEIIANSNFLIVSKGSFSSEPVSFIIKNKVLISHRNYEHNSFKEVYNKLKNLPVTQLNGFQVFLNIFENRIDLDADQVEVSAKNISLLSKKLTKEKLTDEEIILTITNYQELTMVMREVVVDKQRVVSSLLRSDFFPNVFQEKLRIMIKDIGSLLDHITFNFERLEFLQNTFLGLIDIEQNKIIKIFTVVTVIFMPPTLIASIYGMNFLSMPELRSEYGYPLALMLMVVSSALTLLFFKRKKWL